MHHPATTRVCRNRLTLVLGCLATLGLPPSAGAQQDAGKAHTSLGSIAFENSGAAVAQPAFDRGLLLLHSFEYVDAAEAFREAQELDPDFAMAYWGEAMTYNHGVWFEQDREAALGALGRYAPTAGERARRAGPDGGGTEREAAYMRAVDVLYGGGEKESRDDAYLAAMTRLHAAYPDDEDAAAFHALALLSSAHEGRDFATYMKSAGILEQVVDANPDHPGIAHYLIHSYDDPIHAPLGIRAARAYSGIAPDAAHAQHMTSHIFVALGMWDDVVAANENSMRVVNAARAANDLPPGACGHYNTWLEYGYLQQGRRDDALRLVRECYDRTVEMLAGDEAERGRAPVGSYASMLSQYVVDAGDPRTGALDWPIDLTGRAYARSARAFATGYAAAGRGDAETLEAAIATFEAAREEVIADPGREPYGAFAQRLEALQAELDAMRASLAGDLDAAIALARMATEIEEAMPFEYGPPFIDKPTHELLGELLLAADRPEEAAKAFETAVGRTPHRQAAEAGLAAARAATETLAATD